MLPGIVDEGDPMSAYSEIICGWISKAVMDHANLATKNGAPYVGYSRNQKETQKYAALRDEFQGSFWLEDIVRFFMGLALPREVPH